MQLNMPNSVTSTRNQYPPHPLPVVQSPDVGLAIRKHESQITCRVREIMYS